MEFYKCVLFGNFEFGKENTFNKVLEQYNHRLEVYYKNDLFLTEENFKVERFSFEVPKFFQNGTDKTWKNTVSFLQMLSQYAVSGRISGWKLSEKKLVDYFVIEPDNEKIPVQNYIKGSALIQQEGMEEEGIKALNKAIKKFQRHAEAYERRAYINYQLGNIEEAMDDFTKCINISPFVPEAFFGRAKLLKKEDRLEEAIADLEMALKGAIPHQEIYWQCRKFKGECHFALDQFELASTEFKFYCHRRHVESSDNYKDLPNVYMMYGKSLSFLGKHDQAIQMYNKATEFPSGKAHACNLAENSFMRGLAKRSAGYGGFKKDLKEAASLGSKEAEAILEEIS